MRLPVEWVVKPSHKRRQRRATIRVMLIQADPHPVLAITSEEILEAERRAFSPREHRAIADDFHHIHLWAAGEKFDIRAVRRSLERLRSQS